MGAAYPMPIPTMARSPFPGTCSRRRCPPTPSTKDPEAGLESANAWRGRSSSSALSRLTDRPERDGLCHRLHRGRPEAFLDPPRIGIADLDQPVGGTGEGKDLVPN